MYKFFSVMLIAFAVSTPAQADVFGIYSSSGGPEQVVDGHVYAPAQNGVVQGSMHGYPFYSGCCESKSSYYDGLWDGFCGSKGCGMKSRRPRHHGHLKGGCGCGIGHGMSYGHSSCGKGGCGYAAPYTFGGKASWGGHMSHRGFGVKGGYGCGGACGGKGCDVCAPRGPKHCRLGLFDWLHFGHGHGCSVCGDVGCSSCGGKGGFGKGSYIEHGPVQGYDKSYYGTPSEAHGESTLQPPEVIVEPTSISDRSAWRREVPVNPFARPFSY
jgi:hypothetical protein